MTGAVVSIVHEKVAAEPVLPMLSVARTAKLCAPSARPVNCCGLVHGTKPALSRLHSRKATPEDTPLTVGSLAWKAKFAVDELLRAAGVVSKAEAGPVLSTEYTAPVK